MLQEQVDYNANFWCLKWGDPTNTSLHIKIDGEKVGVRENLWWALWHLRDEEVERVIWVDALCINQSHEGERNHQVCDCLTFFFFLVKTHLAI